MCAEHSPEHRVIVALDTPDAGQAISLARSLHPDILWFKVGLELFTSAGPAVIQELRQLGAEVFLDLKLHDIPNTVARAVAAMRGLGVGMTTIHAGGGTAMMEAAVQARAASGPALLAVTVLTSLDGAMLHEVGVRATPQEQVLQLAGLAARCGMNGAVCSPLEVAAVRAQTGEGFLLVTPESACRRTRMMIKPGVAGPAEALRNGASFLVVGRPITRAADPRAAARRVQQALG